jgi:hypothetical protein
LSGAITVWVQIAQWLAAVAVWGAERRLLAPLLWLPERAHGPASHTPPLVTLAHLCLHPGSQDGFLAALRKHEQLHGSGQSAANGSAGGPAATSAHPQTRPHSRDNGMRADSSSAALASWELVTGLLARLEHPALAQADGLATEVERQQRVVQAEALLLGAGLQLEDLVLTLAGVLNSSQVQP